MNLSFLLLILLILITFQIQTGEAELDLEKIRADILSNHNYHRKRHQVGELVRKTEIEKIAQDYSEYLASIEEMKHSGNGYGENLYYCYASNGICVTGEKASQKWYDEVSAYDYNNPVFSQDTGHFTQLVWKGSTQIGCGAACSANKKCYVTCNYYPPGNYQGQFANNVFPLKEGEDNNNNNEGMSTAGKVFLSIFIIIIAVMIAFAVYHFAIKKRSFTDIKNYFSKS